MRAVQIGPPQAARTLDAPVTISSQRYQDVIATHDEVGRACFAVFGGYSEPSIADPELRRDVASEARKLGAETALVIDVCQIGTTPGISISFVKARLIAGPPK